MKNVLLIYPSFYPDWGKADINHDVDLDADGKVVPMGLISIAAFLETNGYNIKIFDARFYRKKDLLSLIKREIKNVDCAGISAMTSQVKHGLQLADCICSLNKDIPIVWGGIHPTLFPEQTCQDRAVDYVVKGEGEYAFRDLLRYFDTGKPDLCEIRGLIYKEDGVIQTNLPTEPLDVTKLPRPAYHLLDIEKYIKRRLINGKVVRGLDILTSRGCPYRCAFCVNPFLTAKKWRAISAEQTLEDIDYLVNKYQLNGLWFMDDFFFGKKDRVKQIARGMVVRKYNMIWEANIRADNFDSGGINDEFLELLKKSGCYNLRIGMESGSDRVLKLLKKDIKVSQIKRAVKQCSKHNIIFTGFWMMGVPGERIDEIKKTLSLIWKLHYTYPQNPVNAPGIFRPYPGCELYEKCKGLGFDEPASLKMWADKDLYAGYLGADTFTGLENARFVSDLRMYATWFAASKRKISGPEAILIRVLGGLSEWRHKHNYWGLRIEMAIYKIVRFFYRILVKPFLRR